MKVRSLARELLYVGRQAGNHAKLTGACLQRFVSNTPEVFILEKFCYFFVKLRFFSLKVKFVGENTNFLGGRVYVGLSS